MLYNVIKYFSDVLGAKLKLIHLLDLKLSKLPYYLIVNYDFYEGELDGKKLIFIDSTGRQKLTALQYEKQINAIKKIFNEPVILVIDELEPYNRKRLIEHKISFVEPGKQIYMPDLLIDLKNIRKVRNTYIEKFSPVTQRIFFFHLLNDSIEGKTMIEITKIFNYSAMSISRAVNELCKTKLAEVTRSRFNEIKFTQDKKMLWDNALKYLINPVQKTFYVDKLPEINFFSKTGISALSYYTDIASKGEKEYAVSKIVFNELKNINSFDEFNNIEGNYYLEVWKYDPVIMSRNGYVDPLSLYMIYKENTDERIQGALEQLIKKEL